MIGDEQERALERANAAISVFEVEAKLAKIAYGARSSRRFLPKPEKPSATLARLYDMTIVLQPESSMPATTTYSAGGFVQFRRADVDGSLHPQRTARCRSMSGLPGTAAVLQRGRGGMRCRS